MTHIITRRIPRVHMNLRSRWLLNLSRRGLTSDG